MLKIGLGSKQVAKLFQLVAVMLIGAVLGRTQCMDMCSLPSVERHGKSSQAAEHEMPCHHESGQEDSNLPATDPPCSHLEFVAEKFSKISSTDDLQAICFIAVRDVAQVIPVTVNSSLVVVDETFPRFSPLILSSILRI